jgi:hypothetical protein
MHTIARLAAMLLLITVSPVFSWAAEQYDPVYMEKPLSYWMESLRNRGEEMKLAFAAINTLGPDAESAVPELVRILSEPFTAIWVGADTREQVAAKVANIQLRAEAVDALGNIGAPAASSTPALIQWALMVRVVPMNVRTREEKELYIDLIAVDVLERMRVAGTVALFGKSAIQPVAVSLASQNDEERKLAVAILSEHAAPIAASLLKSDNCESRKLGIAILTDMWPVVSADHIKDLAGTLTCGLRNSATEY